MWHVSVLLSVATVSWCLAAGPTQPATRPDGPSATAPTTQAAVEHLLDCVRTHEIIDERPVLALPPVEVLKELARHVGDANGSARQHVQLLGYRIVLRAQPGSAERLAGLEMLTEAVDAARSQLELRMVAGWLREMPGKEWPARLKDAVAKHLGDKEVPRDLVLLAGQLGHQELKPALEKLAQTVRSGTQKWSFNGPNWAALLALARMGDETAARQVVIFVTGNKDQVLRATGLAHDLAYTRRPEAVRVLVANVLSNERLPELVPGFRPWFAADSLPLLSGLIKGVPLDAAKLEDLTEEDLGRTRKWLRDHPKVQIEGSNVEVDLSGVLR